MVDKGRGKGSSANVRVIRDDPDGKILMDENDEFTVVGYGLPQPVSGEDAFLIATNLMQEEAEPPPVNIPLVTGQYGGDLSTSPEGLRFVTPEGDVYRGEFAEGNFMARNAGPLEDDDPAAPTKWATRDSGPQDLAPEDQRAQDALMTYAKAGAEGWPDFVDGKMPDTKGPYGPPTPEAVQAAERMAGDPTQNVDPTQNGLGDYPIKKKPTLAQR